MKDAVAWIRVKAVEIQRCGWIWHVSYFEQKGNGLDVKNGRKKGTPARIVHRAKSSLSMLVKGNKLSLDNEYSESRQPRQYRN